MNTTDKRAENRSWSTHLSLSSLMDIVEPRVFREDNLFDADGGEAGFWWVCLFFEILMVALMIIMTVFEVWWALPILAFPTSVSWRWRSAIVWKAGRGYPYLEPRDMLGLSLFAWMSFFVCLAWFNAV